VEGKIISIPASAMLSNPKPSLQTSLHVRVTSSDNPWSANSSLREGEREREKEREREGREYLPLW